NLLLIVYKYRPLSGSSRKRSLGWYYHLYHTGVVVTTTDGSRWLIHKGDGYGENWDTVITNAGYMSSKWTRMKCGTVSGHTVNDFMQAGRIDCEYNVLTCNCQHASKGMWRLVTEVRC
ncbi:uncharacterized protein LOC123523859, partial [Mercenaria mercenaria]|uniref:uncharacterized protein LOC123523859 n=1 Tax=Mercenaria mercenaria TaxID=6596 RepID=UPI00234EF607